MKAIESPENPVPFVENVSRPAEVLLVLEPSRDIVEL
jgi:hypothetical protein|tara:strand:+ start:898 stop:1008 length:111 start_codon:yes stop_codon:yes gene_type:complete